LKDHDDLKKILGPCGLNCEKCISFEDGEIKKTAILLKELLGDNFAAYASRFASFDPAFSNYPAFTAFLDRLVSGGCQGCREGECLFQGCRVKDCVKERGVDFCFQCEEFPCTAHGLQGGLKRKWEEKNRMMKEMGVEGFYEKTKEEKRYP